MKACSLRKFLPDARAPRLSTSRREVRHDGFMPECTVPAGTSGAAPRAYVTVRTFIVKVISPLQNDVRRLRCACVRDTACQARLARHTFEKSFALQFFKRSAPDLPSSHHNNHDRLYYHQFRSLAVDSIGSTSTRHVYDGSSDARVKTTVNAPFLRSARALEQVFFH